jgi:hypothetical protein
MYVIGGGKRYRKDINEVFGKLIKRFSWGSRDISLWQYKAYRVNPFQWLMAKNDFQY